MTIMISNTAVKRVTAMRRTNKQHVWVWAALIGLAVLALAPVRGRAMEDKDFPLEAAKPAAAPTQTVGKADAPTLSGMLGKLTVSMGVVFALMAGVVWAARRYLPQGVKNAHASQGIEILATR